MILSLGSMGQLSKSGSQNTPFSWVIYFRALQVSIHFFLHILHAYPLPPPPAHLLVEYWSTVNYTEDDGPMGRDIRGSKQIVSLGIIICGVPGTPFA